MLLHIALVAEILATVICIHCIYGKKVKFDIKTVGLILGILIILEAANTFQIGVFSFSVYLVLFVYCKRVFDSRVVEILISLTLCMIIITSTQFICSSIIRLIVTHEYFRNVINNVLTLIILSRRFMAYGLQCIYKGIVKQSRHVVILICFMCFVIMSILLQGKVLYRIQMQYFVFTVPAIFMLLYSITKWYFVQTKLENIEFELQKGKENQKNYDSLLTQVRLRQHEFKNHLTAILSAHYTYKTYEKLVQAQNEYCTKLMNENRYNNLLTLGDNVLAGFLYGKFEEAEKEQINVNYNVCTQLGNIQVATYYVVEMLGILLDNAIESAHNSAEKVISFDVLEIENAYEFLIGNPCCYVSYDEILEWFEIDKSIKGSGRGVGLYHLKCLCEELQCEIQCRNIEIEKRNWIIFTLKCRKADDK